MAVAEDDVACGSEAIAVTMVDKRVISTINFGYPRLTLKEGPKVKSEHIRRFLAHDFL